MNTGAGDNFTTVAENAKRLAAERNFTVEFEFNGVNCAVNSETNLEWLYRYYADAWDMGWKDVGPFCLKEYDKETKAELKQRKAIAEEKAAEQSRQYKIKEDNERAAFEEKVKGIEIELKDAPAWNHAKEINSDPYGKCAFDYAEGWAKLMQVEMSKGKKLIECAELTSHELGFYGITGFMYGCAVGALSQCWKHGEELRKWHNKEYNHEGDGVVNPAILSISV